MQVCRTNKSAIPTWVACKHAFNVAQSVGPRKGPTQLQGGVYLLIFPTFPLVHPYSQILGTVVAPQSKLLSFSLNEFFTQPQTASSHSGQCICVTIKTKLDKQSVFALVVLQYFKSSKHGKRLRTSNELVCPPMTRKDFINTCCSRRKRPRYARRDGKSTWRKQ